jgi:hypothetical protein
MVGRYASDAARRPAHPQWRAGEAERRRMCTALAATHMRRVMDALGCIPIGRTLECQLDL